MKPIEDIVIIGAPYSAGCPMKGTEKAPITFERIFNKEFHFLQPSENEKQLNSTPGAASYLARLRDVVVSYIHDGKRVLTIGGDHTIALGTVAASLLHDDNLGLIWIDAHTDINTELTSITENLHGMPVAALMGICSSELNKVTSIHVKPENIVYIGTRSMDAAEVDIIRNFGIQTYTMHDVRTLGLTTIISLLSEQFLQKGIKHIHISFDVDVMDPSIVDAISVPEQEGLITTEYQNLISSLSLFKENICAMDIVEYNVALDQSHKTYFWLKEEIPRLLALLYP